MELVRHMVVALARKCGLALGMVLVLDMALSLALELVCRLGMELELGSELFFFKHSYYTHYIMSFTI